SVMGMVMCLPSSKEIRVIIDSSPSIHDMIPDFRSGASSTSRPPKVCPASSIDRAGHASSPVAGSSAYTTALPAPEEDAQPCSDHMEEHAMRRRSPSPRRSTPLVDCDAKVWGGWREPSVPGMSNDQTSLPSDQEYAVVLPE